MGFWNFLGTIFGSLRYELIVLVAYFLEFCWVCPLAFEVVLVVLNQKVLLCSLLVVVFGVQVRAFGVDTCMVRDFYDGSEVLSSDEWLQKHF